MTTNLPASLAQFIPTMFHVEAKVALDAYVNQTIVSNAERTKEDILRGIVAYLASHGLEESATQAAFPASPKQHVIATGNFGVRHAQYVSTFRAKFPNGERELRDMIESFPPGTEISRTAYDAIKRHFGMGNRAVLLPPMMRELGCRDDSWATWTTPVLRIVRTGNF
jgi:hypothetical protein